MKNEQINDFFMKSQITKDRFAKRIKVSGYNPVGFNLYNHQTHGIWHGLKNKSCGFFLDMGTGKTAITLNVARARYLAGQVKRVLVVCPKIALYSWERDAAVCFPEAKVHVGVGAVDEKAQQFIDFKSGVFLINYESFRIMMQKASDGEIALPIYNMMIIDESHKIKNYKTEKKHEQTKHVRLANSGAVLAYASRVQYRAALTGTPISGTLEDLWTQLHFIDPGKIVPDNFYKFRDRYCNMGGYMNKQVVGFKNVDELIARMAPYTMTVDKEECLDLPEKIFHYVDLEMDATQLALYRIAEEKAKIAIDFLEGCINGEDPGGDITSILTMILRLAQISSGILSTGKNEERMIDTPKTEAVEEIVEDAVARGDKVVIFSRFIPSVDLLKEKLKKYNPLIIKGKMSAEKLKAVEKAFQGQEEYKVLIAQTDAASTALTLTRASTCIFYSYDYNPLTFIQAVDRLHRIGQKKKVNYFILQCRGTIDSIIIQAIQKKQKFAKGIKESTKLAEMAVR